MRFWWLLLGCLVAVTGAAAQEPPRTYRLAVIVPGGRVVDRMREFLLPELAKRGFQEGRNLILDVQVTEDSGEPPPARDLVARRPDAILAIGGPSIAAAMAATTTIPIVMFGGDQLVVAGGLARPLGNATGFVISALSLEAKRLELLAELAPTEGSLSVVFYRGTLDEAERVAGLNAMAARLGRPLVVHHIDDKREFPALVTAVRGAGGRSLLVGGTAGFARDGAALTPIATAAGLATACHWRFMAEDGCLISYGPSYAGIFVRTSHYIARLFRGTPVGELPIEAPSVFEMVVNLKTAQALGLAIPGAILARADDVIE